MSTDVSTVSSRKLHISSVIQPKVADALVYVLKTIPFCLLCIIYFHEMKCCILTPIPSCISVRQLIPDSFSSSLSLSTPAGLIIGIPSIIESRWEEMSKHKIWQR